MNIMGNKEEYDFSTGVDSPLYILGFYQNLNINFARVDVAKVLEGVILDEKSNQTSSVAGQKALLSLLVKYESKISLVLRMSKSNMKIIK